MTIDVQTYLMLAALIGLMVIGLPLAFVTGLVAVGFAYALFGPPGILLLASRVYSFLNEYALVAVPMFILMASVLERSGVARDLFKAMHVWAGGLRGGLAVQTLVVAVLMAAMTGIIGGEIVLLGLVALPQMLALNYDRKLAIGTICAGGSLGTMIPPSIVLIFYGLFANVAIGDLFIATILPGLMLAGLYLAYILVRCHLQPELGPPAPAHELDMPVLEKLKLLRGVILPIMVAVFVLGSIYGGIASVTEAASVGVVGVMLSAFLRGELDWPMMRDALRQTMLACGTLIWLTLGATALIGVYNLMGGTAFVKNAITGLDISPIMVILLMMAILVVLGMFMDWIGILFLTTPIFLPVVTSFGYSPVWFGILFCMNMQISYLTPPFGPAAFYLKGVAPPEISLQDIFSAMWPFIILQVIGVLIVLFNPGVALWLPSKLAG